MQKILLLAWCPRLAPGYSQTPCGLQKRYSSSVGEKFTMCNPERMDSLGTPSRHQKSEQNLSQRRSVGIMKIALHRKFMWQKDPLRNGLLGSLGN